MNANTLHDAAVLLNANARKVSRRMLTGVEQFVPKAQTYLSHSFDDARRAVKEIVDHGYPVVFCGGGDGTLVSTINQFKTYIDEKNRVMQGAVQDAIARHPLPKFGVLKLGTGNGIAGWVGNLKGIEPLAALRRGFEVRTRRLPLIESESRHFHFGGLGWDAAIINDYSWFKTRMGKMPVVRKFSTGFLAYMAAIASRTVPRAFFGERPHVRVINEGDEVFECRLGEAARRLPYRAGDTIYEGPVSVMGAGTTPYYGYNMVAFPFADAREGFMNFRVVDIPVSEALMHSPGIFRGRYQSRGFFDFLVTRVRMEFDRPTPLQIGGDAMGVREHLSFALSDFAVDLLDFSPA
ncbi:MAG: hypothetical protein IT350_11650 [Deltaproteobacteria bacterium]|nr:hypothetical protein [Deltaproteobacteria bacterium]